MTREVAIRNLEMIRIAFVDPVTKEQRKLINDTVDMAISALSENKGEWIYDGDCIHCSSCKSAFNNLIGFNFCPNCGADMREGE